MKHILILFLLMSAGLKEIPAQSGQGWIKLGEVTVTSDFDNESIMITGSEKIRSIKLKAATQAIQITTIDVYYDSGEMQNISKRETIDAGMEMQPLILKPGQILKKVVFSYKLFAGKQNNNVLVELYGIK